MHADQALSNFQGATIVRGVLRKRVFGGEMKKFLPSFGSRHPPMVGDTPLVHSTMVGNGVDHRILGTKENRSVALAVRLLLFTSCKEVVPMVY